VPGSGPSAIASAGAPFSTSAVRSFDLTENCQEAIDDTTDGAAETFRFPNRVVTDKCKAQAFRYKDYRW